jgi:hypothetical protein
VTVGKDTSSPPPTHREIHRWAADPGPERILEEFDTYRALARRLEEDARRLRRRRADLAVATVELRRSLQASTPRTRRDVMRHLWERVGVPDGLDVDVGLGPLDDIVDFFTDPPWLEADEEHERLMGQLKGASTLADACDQLLRRVGAAPARQLTTLLQLAGFATTPSGYQTVARTLARDRRFVRVGGGVWRLADPRVGRG